MNYIFWPMDLFLFFDCFGIHKTSLFFAKWNCRSFFVHTSVQWGDIPNTQGDHVGPSRLVAVLGSVPHICWQWWDWFLTFGGSGGIVMPSEKLERHGNRWTARSKLDQDGTEAVERCLSRSSAGGVSRCSWTSSWSGTSTCTCTGPSTCTSSTRDLAQGVHPQARRRLELGRSLSTHHKLSASVHQ